MRLGRALVIVNGVLFAGFGLGFMAAPSFFSGLFTGGVFSTPSAIIDVRATYGGLGLGLGLWLLLCSKEHVRLGLVGSLIVLTSIMLGRVAGLIVDDLRIDMAAGTMHRKSGAQATLGQQRCTNAATPLFEE